MVSRSENGHLRGVSRAVGPKQVVSRPQFGHFRGAVASKVQSKWSVARSLDIYAALDGLKVQSKW